MVYGCTLNGLISWILAKAYPIAFYDANGKLINSSYSPTESTDKKNVSITINDELLAKYPNAEYCRLGTDLNYNPSISFPRDNAIKESIKESIKEYYAIYKIYNFDKILFCGDSVTKGYVVEGDENKQYIYKEMPEKSYPHQFGKMFPGIDITIQAQSGISATGWLNSFYPKITFSDYDLIVFELGLNGYLNINDIDKEGTNTNDYRKLVSQVRSQNANAVIALVRSSHFSTHWLDILNYIAEESNCIVIDLCNTDYLNLDDKVFHGYYQNGDKRSIDWAHFTRKGYNAKAFVFSRLLEEKLVNDTMYTA